MKRRYIAATAIAAFAAADLHPDLAASWPTVALVAIGAALLIGAHTLDQYVESLDGVRAGALDVDADDGEGA